MCKRRAIDTLLPTPPDHIKEQRMIPPTTTTPSSTVPARSQPAAAVQLIDVSKTYAGAGVAVHALKQISLAFAAGTFTALMGPSGSGKSTLLHCAAGLETPSAGQVFLGERALGPLSEQQRTRLRRTEIGFIFQAFNLLPVLTVAENIALPLTLAGRSPERAWFAQLVAATGLEQRLHHRPAELSGGQQQRVAIARALITRPMVVFADEPTGNLDSTTGAEILRLLRSAVSAYAQTVIMVTHDPVAASVADQVVFVRDGRIVDELARPTAATVIATMQALGGSAG
jgi:putative ABC transport system ATP-binding protein